MKSGCVAIALTLWIFSHLARASDFDYSRFHAVEVKRRAVPAQFCSRILSSLALELAAIQPEVFYDWVYEHEHPLKELVKRKQRLNVQASQSKVPEHSRQKFDFHKTKELIDQYWRISFLPEILRKIPYGVYFGQNGLPQGLAFTSFDSFAQFIESGGAEAMQKFHLSHLTFVDYNDRIAVNQKSFQSFLTAFRKVENVVTELHVEFSRLLSNPNEVEYFWRHVLDTQVKLEYFGHIGPHLSNKALQALATKQPTLRELFLPNFRMSDTAARILANASFSLNTLITSSAGSELQYNNAALALLLRSKHKFKTLGLYDLHGEVKPQLITTLIQNQPQLRALSLEKTTVNPKDLLRLAQSNLPIAELILGHGCTNVTDAVIRELITGPLPLEILKIRSDGEPISDKTLLALAESKKQLTSVTLDITHYGDWDDPAPRRAFKLGRKQKELVTQITKRPELFRFSLYDYNWTRAYP